MKSLVLASVLLLAALQQQDPVFAHGYSRGEITVRHPWTRATPPGASVAAGFLEIRNAGKEPDRMIGASSPVAERVELHVTVREGEILKMREVKDLEAPARSRLVLRPGGPHLMLTGLKKPFVKGERIPLVLRFEKSGEVAVELEVQALDSGRAHH